MYTIGNGTPEAVVAQVLCPTDKFWDCSPFVCCPSCGWGSGGYEVGCTEQQDMHTVVGNTVSEDNPKTIDCLGLGVTKLIVKKALEKKANEAKFAAAARDEALAFKNLQEKAGVDLKLAWAQPDRQLLQLGRIDRSL